MNEYQVDKCFTNTFTGTVVVNNVLRMMRGLFLQTISI